MAKTVPFVKIKKGAFYRMRGAKSLWQKIDDEGSQCVKGKVGWYEDTHKEVKVIPVNAKIVEET